MIFVSKEQWGANDPICVAGTVHPNSRTEFFVHHSTGTNLGDEDSYQWVRNIQNQHLYVNGWCDIGYNFLVDEEGRVFEGRGWNAVGAHCPGHNTSAVGVCYLGDGAERLAPKALVAIRELADEADRQSGKSLKRLGHRDGIATACPGDNLHKWVHDGMPVEDIPITSESETDVALTDEQDKRLTFIEKLEKDTHKALTEHAARLERIEQAVVRIEKNTSGTSK